MYTWKSDVNFLRVLSSDQARGMEEHMWTTCTKKAKTRIKMFKNNVPVEETISTKSGGLPEGNNFDFIGTTPDITNSSSENEIVNITKMVLQIGKLQMGSLTIISGGQLGRQIGHFPGL